MNRLTIEKSVSSHQNNIVLWNMYSALGKNWTVKIYETLFFFFFIKVWPAIFFLQQTANDTLKNCFMKRVTEWQMNWPGHKTCHQGPGTCDRELRTQTLDLGLKTWIEDSGPRIQIQDLKSVIKVQVLYYILVGHVLHEWFLSCRNINRKLKLRLILTFLNKKSLP